MKDKYAVRVIENVWSKFLKVRGQDGSIARTILPMIGIKLTTFEEINEARQFDEIIVRAYGDAIDPLHGHSVFYFDRKFSVHLTYTKNCIKELLSPDGFSRYPLNPRRVLMDQDFGEDEIVWPRILVTDSRDLNMKDKINHIIKKGGLFYKIPNKKRSIFFHALNMETRYYYENEYCYGRHYNCNTFVSNVLRRILSGGALI